MKRFQLIQIENGWTLTDGANMVFFPTIDDLCEALKTK
jgi:hypothetical protein